PPPLSTRQDPHGQQKPEYPLQIIDEMCKFSSEALFPQNPGQTLSEHQIRALLDRSNQLRNSLSNEKNLEKIMERLDRLERRSLVTVPAQLPMTWASATTKNRSSDKTNTSKPQTTNPITGQHLPTIPSNKELNEFKKASMVIRTSPGFSGLDMLSAPEITTKINEVLRSIDARIESLPIGVAGIA
ncbi:hypothetical protein CROQUDRAFT_40367, partial [Cronartium quercuum f. sp. fusiforme G11]